MFNHNNPNKLSSLEQSRVAYLQQAKRDIETRRALHNAQLNQYNQEIKPLKRQQSLNNFKQVLSNIGRVAGKMGPQ